MHTQVLRTAQPSGILTRSTNLRVRVPSRSHPIFPHAVQPDRAVVVFTRLPERERKGLTADWQIARQLHTGLTLRTLDLFRVVSYRGKPEIWLMGRKIFDAKE